MPIQAPTVAPVVNLPVTGVDPTAAAAAAAPVVAPVVAALSPADAALIEATKAQFAGNAAQPAATTGEGSPAAAAGDAGNAATTGGDAGAASDPATAPADGGKPAVELTASQKIAAKIASKKAQIIKLTEEVQRLEGQFRSADLLDSVKAGSVIKARVGRAETAREVTASVIGVQTLESGDVRYKVYFGEGFDAETVVIQSSQIVDVVQV